MIVCVLQCCDFVGVDKSLICSVFLMRFAANSLGAEGGAAVAQLLPALTALQTLDLQCNDACFDMLLLRSWVVFMVGVLLECSSAWFYLCC